VSVTDYVIDILLILRGEAGAGKSVLLDYVAGRASASADARPRLCCRRERNNAPYWSPLEP
jgi:predicted ATPase